MSALTSKWKAARRRRWPVHAAALVFFLILALSITYPLLKHLTTAVPGAPRDNFEFLWRVAWFKQAVFDPRLSPFHTDRQYYPFGYDLMLGPVTLSQIALSLPLAVVGGEVLGYNIVSLLSLVLAAFGAYLFVLDLTGRPFAGLASGVIFGFCPALLALLTVGHFNLLGIVWLPFALLALRRVLEGRGLRWSAIAGAFCLLIIFSDWYNVPMLGCAMLIYGLAHVGGWRRRLRQRRALTTVAAFLAILCVAVLGAVALTQPLWSGGVRTPAYSLAYVDYISPSLDYFLVPRALGTLIGQPPVSADVYNSSMSVFLGFLPPVLAVVGILWGKCGDKRALAALGLCSLLLAMGPRLRWNGMPVLIPVPVQIERVFTAGVRLLATRLAVTPMPSYYALRRAGHVYVPLPALFLQMFVPFMSKMRYWGRFSVVLSLAVAALAGMGIARIEAWLATALPKQAPDAGRKRRRWIQPVLGATLLVLLFLEFAILPFHIGYCEVRPQPVDDWLARDAGDAAIAEFPRFKEVGPGLSVYRTLFHGKSICAGSDPFAPEGYRAAVPLLNAFPQTEAVTLLASWGVKYVLVGARSYGEQWASIQQAIAAQPGLRLKAVLDDVPIYRDEGLWNCVPGYNRQLSVDQIHVYQLTPAPQND